MALSPGAWRPRHYTKGWVANNGNPIVHSSQGCLPIANKRIKFLKEIFFLFIENQGGFKIIWPNST
jgi:hypothetical protein